MKRIDQILSADNFSALPTQPRLWTASVFLTALLVSVTLAFCQEGNPPNVSDGGYATPEGGCTHLVFFRPQGDFAPQNPTTLLSIFHAKLLSEGPVTGYFRTKPVAGKLLGSLCTGEPEKLERLIKSVPELEFVRTERLTKESFEAYEKTKSLSLLPADGSYATPEGGFTHLIVYGPKGDFKPTNPMAYLSISSPKLVEYGVHAGYFRTKPEEGKLIAYSLTATPEAYKKLIDSIPQFEYIRTERLTKESFEAYEKTTQLSLPPADGGYATPQGGFTHLIVYGPKGDFKPTSPTDYMNIVNPQHLKYGVHAGYFRSKPEEGKLIAYNVTTTPEAYKKLIDSIPQFEYIRTERLTKEMFEAYEKTKQLSLPPTDGGYATPNMGYTHLVIFSGKGDFAPRTSQALLGKLNAVLMPTKIPTGYFRTWVEKDRLIGGICTNDVAKLRKVFDLIPDLELVSVKPLSEQSFKEHSEKEQESIPTALLREIEQSEWYGKLNEWQKKYVRWDENQFAYVYDPKNYDVGDDRSGFEKRWVEELEKPEPGHPGRTELSKYDEAIFGLATIKSDKALKPLVKIAAERVLKDNAHRHYATKALGVLGDPAAVPELIPLTYHFNFNTRWEAQVALVRLTGQNFGSDAKAWGEWYMASRESLGKDLPAFDSSPVDWSCGSSNAELLRHCDPAVQEESDNRTLRTLGGE